MIVVVTWCEARINGEVQRFKVYAKKDGALSNELPQAERFKMLREARTVADQLALRYKVQFGLEVL